MPNNRQTNWGAIVLEATLVVFGVVLAYSANEWREGKQDAARAAQAVSSITEELEENRGAVIRSLEYHTHLLDTLGVIMAADGADPDGAVFDQGFINPASMLTTAWDVAQATDILGQVEYETLLTISRMYEEQESYEFQSERVGELIYKAMFDQGLREVYHNYRNFFSIIGTFYYRECQLLEHYRTALGHLGSDVGSEELPAVCSRVLRR